MKKRKRWQYAMYKGDKLLSVGTSNEICKEMGISIKTFQHYRTGAYRKRIENRKAKDYRTVIRIDDEIDDELEV